MVFTNEQESNCPTLRNFHLLGIKFPGECLQGGLSINIAKTKLKTDTDGSTEFRGSGKRSINLNVPETYTPKCSKAIVYRYDDMVVKVGRLQEKSNSNKYLKHILKLFLQRTMHINNLIKLSLVLATHLCMY